MTAYIALMILVILCALIGLTDKNLDNLLFRIETVIMTVFLCFRYGQGSDYHNYEYFYIIQTKSPGLSYDVEFLFSLLNKMIAKAGWGFPVFIALVGLICMLLTYRGISKLSSFKTVSVMLLLPTYYLTYYFSALREGIALSIALGIIIPYIVEEKRHKALLWIALLFFVHRSSIIMVIMLLPIRWYRIRKLILSISVVLGMAFWVLLQFVNLNIHEFVYSPSYSAVALRVVVFAIISLLYKKTSKSYRVSLLYDIYLIGFCIYLITFASALFSQRGTAYFKIIEVLLVPNMLGYVIPISLVDCRNAMKKSLLAGMVALCIVEGIKNLASYPSQMEYPDKITFYNYQYISIFNKETEKYYKDGI